MMAIESLPKANYMLLLYAAQNQYKFDSASNSTI